MCDLEQLKQGITKSGPLVPLGFFPQGLITPNLQSHPSKVCPLITCQRPDKQDESPVWLRHRVSMSMLLYKDKKHRKNIFWISGQFSFKPNSLDTEQFKRQILGYYFHSLPYSILSPFQLSLYTCGFSFRTRLLYKCLQILSKQSFLGQETTVGSLLGDSAILQNHNLIHLGKKVNAMCNQESSL